MYDKVFGMGEFRFAPPENPIVHAKKFLHILYRTKICAIFA